MSSICAFAVFSTFSFPHPFFPPPFDPRQLPLKLQRGRKRGGGGIVCSGNGKKKPAFPFPPLLVLWVGGGAVYRADFGLLLWPGGLGFAKNPKNTIVDSLNATLITLFKNVQRRVFFAC